MHKLTVFAIVIWTFLAAAAFAFPSAAKTSELEIEGVPLPADTSPLLADKSASPFAGVWFGTWGGWRKTILVVESIDQDGKAKVIYAIAENPRSRRKPAWYRLDANITGRKMRVRGDTFFVTYELSPTGRLFAAFSDGLGFGVMLRQEPDVMENRSTEARWSAGKSEFLPIEFKEDGKTIELETVIFKPSGDGPFPLAVVSHGSTGGGTNKAAFTDTWTNPWFAEFLNARGYMVAFPQRRGRGKSGGLYDEGFHEDRNKGYTCDARRSLAGADRAMEGLAASLDALRKRSDVKAVPVLLAGNSRGGIRSAAYAGAHPGQVTGVINFVGGWLGEGCKTGSEVNQNLFKAGGSFPGPMLWLYGKDDSFYTIEHSRKNFTAFRDSGGKGSFVEVTVPGANNGHWVMWLPPLWTEHVDKYIDAMEK